MESQDAERQQKSFFVSYNRADRNWAEWIAWHLEAAGFTTLLQAWDFGAGSNFVVEMDRAARDANRTIAVLSPDYLTSAYTQAEWAVAFTKDPTGQSRTLLPIRVRECTPTGLLSTVVYTDLVGHDEPTARELLLAAAREGRPKPTLPPIFPAAEVPSASRQPPFPGRLRRYLTTFVGRERELAELTQVLLSSEPLITLTGAAGSGKTRLALQAIDDVLDQFPNGVHFMTLEAIRQPELLLSEIAAKFGIRETPAQQEDLSNRQASGSGGRDRRSLFEVVRDFLSAKQLLLVLDNFEQVIGATKIIVELLANCPGLRLLVTSRELLRVQGEHEFVVRPLSVPNPEHLPPLASLPQYAAVELFAQRARIAIPKFAITADNARTVVAICHRLDGLPLLIELAAARLRDFTIETLSSRLESRLQFLSRGPRDMPVRQQTARAAIAWSCDLLDTGERKLFQRLAVFEGECNVEASTMVCNARGDLGIDPEIGLASLADKSLLERNESLTNRRYRMLGVIKDYALELLAASGEAAEVRSRYAEFFLKKTEVILWPEISGPSLISMDSSDWLETEVSNLRAVLDFAVQERDTDSGLRMALNMRSFWLNRGHVTEGRQRLAALLELARSAQPEASSSTNSSPLERPGELSSSWTSIAPFRLRNFHKNVMIPALQLSALLAAVQNDYSSAKAQLEQLATLGEQLGDWQTVESVILPLALMDPDSPEFGIFSVQYLANLEDCRDRGDDWSLAKALFTAGSVNLRQRDFETAKPYLQESNQLFRSVGDAKGEAMSLHLLAIIAVNESRTDLAIELGNKSLQAARETGDPVAVAIALVTLGQFANLRGDSRSARLRFDEARLIGKESNNLWILSPSLYHLGLLAHRNGDPTTAKSCLEESERIFRKLGNKAGIAESTLALANVDVAQRRSPERCWESMELFRSVGNRLGEAMCFATLGNGEIIMSNYEEALKRFDEARSLFAEVGDSVGAANLIVRIANVYRDQGEYDQSRAKYEEALVLYRSARAKNGIVNATRLLGDLFRRQKKFDDARKRYEEALQLSHEFDDKAAEATCLMALGDLLFELKE